MPVVYSWKLNESASFIDRFVLLNSCLCLPSLLSLLSSNTLAPTFASWWIRKSKGETPKWRYGVGTSICQCQWGTITSKQTKKLTTNWIPKKVSLLSGWSYQFHNTPIWFTHFFRFFHYKKKTRKNRKRTIVFKLSELLLLLRFSETESGSYAWRAWLKLILQFKEKQRWCFTTPFTFTRDCDDSLKCIATLANKFRESCSTSPFSDCQIFVQKHQEEPESEDLSVKMPKLICTLSLWFLNKISYRRGRITSDQGTWQDLVVSFFKNLHLSQQNWWFCWR